MAQRLEDWRSSIKKARHSFCDLFVLRWKASMVKNFASRRENLSKLYCRPIRLASFCYTNDVTTRGDKIHSTGRLQGRIIHLTRASWKPEDLSARAAIAQKRYILLDDLVTSIDCAFVELDGLPSSVRIVLRWGTVRDVSFLLQMVSEIYGVTAESIDITGGSKGSYTTGFVKFRCGSLPLQVLRTRNLSEEGEE
jgi:hypothetical protein